MTDCKVPEQKPAYILSDAKAYEHGAWRRIGHNIMLSSDKPLPCGFEAVPNTKYVYPDGRVQYRIKGWEGKAEK